MGQEIKKLSAAQGLAVKSIIDPHHKEANFRVINPKSLQNVDVCIEFSTPSSVVDNIRKAAGLKKNIVVGTTGWYGRINEVKKIVKSNNVGLIYASNFSVGVNLYFKILENAAKIINKFSDYDVYGLELHHRQKIDSPSGTAKTIGEILLENIKRKKKVMFEKVDRKIKPDELHFASVRAGSFPGIHLVGFDSTADTIELKHTAKNREGFALGAITAAQWIHNRKGLYEINDMMKDIIGG